MTSEPADDVRHIAEKLAEVNLKCSHHRMWGLYLKNAKNCPDCLERLIRAYQWFDHATIRRRTAQRVQEFIASYIQGPRFLKGVADDIRSLDVDWLTGAKK